MLSASRFGARAMSSATKPGKLVLGSGSNVMDLFYPVQRLPQPGDKTYFRDEQFLSDAVVGGVTLNHLSWARALSAPTGLLAFQGDEANGQTIRAKLRELGVSTEYIRVSKDYSTSVSHILSGPDGERTIIMAKASTARLTGEVMRREYDAAIAGRASMITTEISQLPLSGVEYLLDAAAAARIPSLLDVDVTPHIAVTAAGLGTTDELKRCIGKATVLKLTASAAGELLALVSGAKLESTLENVAQQLADATGARLAVITDGSRGSALAAGRKHASNTKPLAAVRVPIYSGVTQRDATGAGDAFFGGVVASLHAFGFPTDAAGLERVGKIAAASGAACVEVIGALPVPGVSSQRMLQLCPETKPLIEAAAQLDAANRSTKVDAPSSSSSSSSSGPTSTSAVLPTAFLSSLLADSEALTGVLGHYTHHLPSLSTSVSSLAGALKACSSSSRASPSAYCTGIGKSGAVAARLAISLRSIGIRASFVHGSEWWHGDLGAAGPGDVVIAFSHSGKTVELVDVARRLKAKGVRVFAVTNDGASPLSREAEGHLPAPATGELLGSVPTRSIVAQEAVCNAIVTSVAQVLGVTTAQFKTNHPGGSIGGATI